MNKISVSLGLAVMLLMSALVLCCNALQQVLLSSGPANPVDLYKQLNQVVLTDYQAWLQPMIFFKQIVMPLTLSVVVGVPLIFAAHYFIIGPKVFSHDEMIPYFSLFARIVHWIAAVAFSLLIVTGVFILLSALVSNGALIRLCREIHLVSALVFALMIPPMFLIWVKDMLPAPYDIKWFFILGGYLSKKKRPIPSGKFNAGQKIWFWLATAGGAVMAYTGWYIYTMGLPNPDLRLYVLIHSYLGVALVAIFMVHVYLTVFAIKGSLGSMITGMKAKEEVQILHSCYKFKE